MEKEDREKLKAEIPEIFREYKAKEDESIYIHTENLLENLFHLDECVNVPHFELIALACIFHDCGKLNPLFQKRINERSKFNSKIEVPHNIISLYIANKYLNRDIEQRFCLKAGEIEVILHAILNHHSYVDNVEYIDRDTKERGLIAENLNLIYQYIMDDNCDFSDLYKSMGIRRFRKIKEKNNESDRKSVLVKGFLHKCDYSASAHREIEIPNTDLLERMHEWKADLFEWNEMQHFAKRHSDENLILIGSTGLGKTEASLLWTGNNKGFYVLPLRTAINTMYYRLKSCFYTGESEYMLGLLHGDTQNIYINSGSEYSEDAHSEDEDLKFWEYYSNTKALSLPLTITTPDQLLRFVFKYPSYEISLATLSYSKVVIDEIQAYAPDILAVLIYAIEKIVKFGGKFAITTATLPPFIYDKIIKVVKDDFEKPPIIAEERFLNEKIRHNVKIREDYCSANDIAEFYRNNKHKESLKILVVVHTVSSAQQFYEQLSELMSEDSEEFEKNQSDLYGNDEFGKESLINLIHAKFIVKDRTYKEKQITADGQTDCKKHVIWIATSIVEASLDIDFDYLFTELSDLSGLFQRMGRCNRKGIKSIDEPNVFVYTKPHENLFRQREQKNGRSMDGKMRGIMYCSLFYLAEDALKEWASSSRKGKMSEADKVKMIDDYYTTEKIRNFERSVENETRMLGESYLDDYDNRYCYIKNLSPNQLSKDEAQKALRNIISFKVIPQSVYESYSSDIEVHRNEIDNIRNKIKELKRNVENYGSTESEIRNLMKYLIKHKESINELTLSVEPDSFINFNSYIEVNYEKIFFHEGKYDFKFGLRRIKDKDGIFL